MGVGILVLGEPELQIEACRGVGTPQCRRGGENRVKSGLLAFGDRTGRLVGDLRGKEPGVLPRVDLAQGDLPLETARGGGGEEGLWIDACRAFAACVG